jgi:hypothetical protein
VDRADASVLEVMDLLFSKVSACEMEDCRLRDDESGMRGEVERLRGERDLYLSRGWAVRGARDSTPTRQPSWRVPHTVRLIREGSPLSVERQPRRRWSRHTVDCKKPPPRALGSVRYFGPRMREWRSR